MIPRVWSMGCVQGTRFHRKTAGGLDALGKCLEIPGMQRKPMACRSDLHMSEVDGVTCQCCWGRGWSDSNDEHNSTVDGLSRRDWRGGRDDPTVYHYLRNSCT